MIVGEQGTGPVVVLEQAERGLEHGVLSLGLGGRVEGMPVSKRNVKSTRRSRLLGHHTQKLDDDGRDSLTFELGGDQTHGLVAHRSDGHEECHLDSVLDESARCLGCGVAHQSSGCGHRAHERKIVRAQ